MAISVRIPTPLQQFTANSDEVLVEAGTIKEMVTNLSSKYPGIQDRLCDDTGKIRRFVNIYVNGEDIRTLQKDETVLKDGDEVSLVPSIAGG
ncbi:MAG TPA: MoaD/ThiS family protein [Armatimonadota bacterium]|nr:MoaD/ThiS family protein [Armatimonadota bacterium]